jgi:hypothetical protein
MSKSGLDTTSQVPVKSTDASSRPLSNHQQYTRRTPHRAGGNLRQLPRFRSTIERLSATDTIARKVISFTGAPGLDVTKSDLRWGVCYTR